MPTYPMDYLNILWKIRPILDKYHNNGIFVVDDMIAEIQVATGLNRENTVALLNHIRLGMDNGRNKNK